MSVEAVIGIAILIIIPLGCWKLIELTYSLVKHRRELIELIRNRRR